MPNQFAKTRPVDKPYAIFRSPDGSFTWHVCKTYQMPEKEKANQYARWFVYAKTAYTFGSFDAGDTYICDVMPYGMLVAAEPEWLTAYGKHLGYPTPQEYLENV